MSYRSRRISKLGAARLLDAAAGFLFGILPAGRACALGTAVAEAAASAGGTEGGAALSVGVV